MNDEQAAEIIKRLGVIEGLLETLLAEVRRTAPGRPAPQALREEAASLLQPDTLNIKPRPEPNLRLVPPPADEGGG